MVREAGWKPRIIYEAFLESKYANKIVIADFSSFYYNQKFMRRNIPKKNVLKKEYNEKNICITFFGHSPMYLSQNQV